MKKTFLLMPLVLFLCSFAPRMGTYGTVGITLYSYTEYTSSGSTSYGIGHSFVTLENNRSWTLDLGFEQLAPFGKCTIGLWGNDGSNSSSNEGRDVSCDGIFYNREAYAFSTLYDNPTDMVKIYSEVDVGHFLIRISNFVGEENYLQYNAEHYSLLGYNCSNFAAEFYAIATQTDFGVISSPSTLRTKMINTFNAVSATKDEIFESRNYWRYNDDGDCFVYPNQ